jgi:hypothetical protein
MYRRVCQNEKFSFFKNKKKKFHDKRMCNAFQTSICLGNVCAAGVFSGQFVQNCKAYDITPISACGYLRQIITAF